MIAVSPLPQQTALVEEGVEKIIGPHEPAACGASAPSEPPRFAGGESIEEADIPSILERGAAGGRLSTSEQSAWTGYELGWRDGQKGAAALADALKPFADACESCDEETTNERTAAWESPMAMAVTYGDFRRAASALNHTGGSDQ